MMSVIWGFLLIHHGGSEGRAVWHQAGVSQVGVLGGTKIPTGIGGLGRFTVENSTLGSLQRGGN